MRIKNKNHLGVFFLILLYADPVFMAVEGLISQHHYKKYFVLYSVILTFLAFIILWSKTALNRYRVNIAQAVALSVMLCMIVSFWCTQYRYGEANLGYLKAFFIMGVRALPAAIVACIVTAEDYDRLVKSIPIFVFLFTASAVICILKAGGFGLYHKRYDSEIHTYQSLGYQAAYAYSLGISYLTCERRRREKFCLSPVVMIMLIPLQLYSVLTLGGKGSILVVLATTGIVLISHSKGRKMLWLIIAGLIVLGPFYFPFVYQSAGVQRFLNIWTDESTSARLQFWKGAIEEGFNRVFIGNGIGAEYYFLGVYSHNILLDVFMELGLFGLLLAGIGLTFTCMRVIRLVKRDRKYLILAIIFFNSLIMLMVSGYYLLEASFMGALAYVLTHKKLYLKRRERSSMPVNQA